MEFISFIVATLPDPGPGRAGMSRKTDPTGGKAAKTRLPQGRRVFADPHSLKTVASSYVDTDQASAPS